MTPMRSAIETARTARGDQRHADRGRTHVLDPADLQVVVGGQAIGELLDRGVEQLDDREP